jgi:hypothetical protein
MDTIDTFRILVYTSLCIITLVPGCNLLYRAVRTRWHVFAYMGMVLLFFALTSMISYLVDVPPWIRALVALDYPVFLTLFVRRVYTRTVRTQRHSTIVLVAIICLKVIHGLNILLFDVAAPAREPVPEALLAPFIVHVVVTATMAAIAFAWFAVNANRAYHESLVAQAPRWVVKRNGFVRLSASIYVAVPMIWFLFPVDEAGFSSPIYFVGSVFALVVVSAFVILTFLGWITPEWFKRVLDKDYAGPDDLIARMDLSQGSVGQETELAKQPLTSGEILGIVDYIGQHIASITKRTPASMKGMLLLAIKMQLHDEALYHATFSEIATVVKGTFKDLLSRASIENPEEAVSKVLAFLARNKANLMMFVA